MLWAPSHSLDATKRMLNTLTNEPASGCLSGGKSQIEDPWASDDHREAQAAFSQSKENFLFKSR
jgi:hypothetical protein